MAEPIGPQAILDEVIVPAMLLLPNNMDNTRACVLLLAICGQEARWKYRRQIKGPARGLWQFEKGGGVRGVLSHAASCGMAADVCEERGVEETTEGVYAALARDDILAACFARLLLWTDPAPLPAIDNERAAWDYYIRNWRPGKPHFNTWGRMYETARATVGE